MQFDGFKKEGIEFLKELKKNNTKEWFENNRHIWQKYIQDPNIAYIAEMGETLQILVPTINAKPKVGGSLFKIYTDVRFGNIKAPIKSKIGLLLWQGPGHRMQSSSFYMHYDKDEYFIAGGIRNFKPPLLKTYREFIKDDKIRAELHLIIEELKAKGYSLPDPKFKRVPKDFDKEDENVYLTLFGAMYAYKTFKIDKTFFSKKILDRAFNIYSDLHKLQQWVYKMSLYQTFDTIEV